MNQLKYIPLLSIFLQYGSVFSQSNSQLLLHTDFIFSQSGKPKQEFFIEGNIDSNALLSIQCYKKSVSLSDSFLIAQIFNKKVTLNIGVSKIDIDYSDKQDRSYIDPTFNRILNDLNIVPPGEYVVYSKLLYGNNSTVFKTIRIYDSTLAVNSNLRKEINQIIEKNAFTKTNKNNSQRLNEEDARFQNKMTKLISKQGVTSQTNRIGAKLMNSFYYDSIFIGRYEITLGENLYNQVKVEKEQLINSSNSLVKNGLDDYESLFSQLKKIKEKNEKEQSIKGEIGVVANVSNQADAFSYQDKNYYELNGNVEMPLMGIPVQVEGYYTTQDINRKIKSSYIRFHYDVDQAKSELMKLVGGYTSQYEQTVSKGKGLDAVYKSYLKGLVSQKEKMLYDLAKETGVKEFSAANPNSNDLGLNQHSIDTAALLNSMLSKLDTSGQSKEQAIKAKDSVYHLYSKAMKKYEHVKELEQKIEKYYTLLEQYKNTTHFDSLMTYDKVKDLKDYENMSYKDMAKKASELLPDGKVKQAATGLTNFDVGVFPKYTSKYTMGGQMLKGLDVGYDIGFATTHATVGKTEYIGRDGSVDKYTCYSGTVKLKPLLKQNIELIYYGYSPSRRMFSEDKAFFSKLNTSYPTFQNPVHIISIKYNGEIGKGIQTRGEVASSFKQGSQDEHSSLISNERLAYAIGLDGDIPKTNITTSLDFEHSGKYFENNTIPCSLKGTDKFKLSGKSTFFKNFLSVGLELNYLIQQNLSNQSTSTRWGFDIKTKSKQYPCVSLSYKPFSTFRSYSDTLGLLQRPILGEVWMAKASYQYKRNKQIYRFMLLYNKNTSTMDTSNYSNDMLQCSFLYTNKKFMGNISFSNLKMNSNVKETIPDWYSQKAYITSLNGSWIQNKQLTLSTGIDLGLSSFGISNTGINAGFNYVMKKVPITYRVSARYNKYKLAETNQWENRVAGVVAIVCGFNIKNEK